MRVTISPDTMSVLASNASTALHLLAMGIFDTSGISNGLSQASRFCDVLSEGEKIRSARRANAFSAEGLAKKDFLNLVCELPDGDRLTNAFPGVREAVSSLEKRIQQTRLPITPDVRRQARELADY